MKPAPPRAAGALVFALIAAEALFVAAYIGHERTVYFWDHAMYFGMARQAYGAFAQDFLAGMAMFRASLAGNYNLVYALPSFPAFALFGVSRLVFILANFCVFFVAYEVAVAFFLRRALGLEWRRALVLSLVFCAAIPPLWLPLLEGYPDIGAAACIVCAAALGLDGAAKPKPFFRALALGALLGFAVLLRRHFVYPAFALLAASACFALWDTVRAKKNRGKLFGRTAAYFAACGAAFVALLALVAPDFLASALTVDYGRLYFSYRKPPAAFLRFVFGGFGYGLLLIAAGGLVLLARRDAAGRRAALFAALFTLLWLAIWCAGPDQTGHHYMLHALPLFVVTGLAGWFLYLAERPDRKKIALGLMLALGLCANSAWALWLSPAGVWPNDNGTPGIFSAPRPPVVRPDYDEWRQLAEYLQRTTTNDDRIMMIGSSFVFNQDLMRSVYAAILGAPDMALRFVRASEIDHEEPAPFDAFAAANIYVVPEPAQYHLDPAGQRVVTAAANRFPPQPPYAALFHEDPEAFRLADNVTVRVWRRAAWTPAILHEVLGQIRRDGPQDDHFAQAWAATVLPLQAAIRTNAGGPTFAAGLFDPAHGDMRLFFDDPLEPGRYRLGFSVAGNCPYPALRLSLLGDAGKEEMPEEFTAAPGEFFRSFEVPAAPPESRFLDLDLQTASAALCRAELRDLRVEKLP